MKVTIPRKSLIASLGTVKDAASHKSSVPVLANVLVTGYEKSVAFTCTDLDITLRTTADAVIDDKSDFTVRVDLLLGLARSFSGEEDQDVVIDTYKEHINVSCGRSKYKLGTLPGDDFPSATKIEAPKEFKLPQARLRKLLAATHFCACTDDARPILASSYLQLNGNLSVVSTDGRRLALVTDDLEEKVSATNVIVPTRAVDQLLRLLDKADDAKTMRIIAGKNAVQFNFSDITITSKLYDGEYPNYRQVVPDDKAISEMNGVDIDRVLLLQALNRVEFISDQCSLEFKNQMLVIRASSTKKDIVGEAVETLLIPKTKEMNSRFNTRFLIQALSAVEDDQVTFYARGSDQPGIFRVKSLNWISVSAALVDPPKK